MAAAVFCATIIAVIVLASSGGGSAGHEPRHRTAAAIRTARRGGHPGDSVEHPHAMTPDPGILAQTHALPSSTTARLNSMMAALWTGVVDNSTSRAMPAFFPKPAYLQVKAIPDAGADYENRLVHGFTRDIAAAHHALGAGASAARLTGVQVPQTYAHWVDPGTCDNRIGYYEVPNARVVYTENGQVRSFGIASMISWRGVWYVVHFGAVLQSGVVDSPSAGPGTSIDTGTC